MSVEQRFEKLERAIRCWRLLGIATSGLLVVVVLVAAAPGGVLVVDKLVIRDSQGRERIVLDTIPDGTAWVSHFDANGKLRIESPHVAEWSGNGHTSRCEREATDFCFHIPEWRCNNLSRRC